MKLLHLLATIAALCAGCSTAPQLTREQWLATQSRTFEGVAKEQVITAAERVLRLADGKDFTIVHNDAGFQANRKWSVFLLVAAENGNDIWTFETRELGGAVKATVSISIASAGAMGIGPTTSPGTFSTMTLPSGGAPVDGPAAYELFWDRVAYLLGKRETWPTCEAADERLSTKKTWGNHGVLCNGFNMTDLRPRGAKLDPFTVPPITIRDTDRPVRYAREE